MRKNIQKGLIIVVAAIILAGVFAWGMRYIKTTYIDNAGSASYDGAVFSSSEIFSGIANLLNPTLRGEEEGRINMLLLGMGGKQHISGALTDTLILASFDITEQRINLISIPRDLWVRHEENFQKINELYETAGGSEVPDIQKTNAVKQKVEDIVGQPIHYTALINFDGVKKIVDAVGGVTIEERQMNGAQALTFIRDRSTSSGDFDRMLRQQALILAIYDKLLEEDALQDSSRAQELFIALQESFAVDASITNILRFSELAENISKENIFSHAITARRNGTLQAEYRYVAGQQLYILTPLAGMEDYGEIQKFIKEKLDN